MKVEAHININAPKEAVWNVISDIDAAVERISAIQKVEVLDRPESGLIGLKWRETRTMFGKEATEIMWITDTVENEFYRTRAESHGAIYISELRIEPSGEGTKLTMEFDGEPQTMGAKIMTVLTGFMFKGATIKAIQQDLDDIKSHVEGRG